jgi:hypothetical protein
VCSYNQLPLWQLHLYYLWCAHAPGVLSMGAVPTAMLTVCISRLRHWLQAIQLVSGLVSGLMGRWHQSRRRV